MARDWPDVFDRGPGAPSPDGDTAPGSGDAGVGRLKRLRESLRRSRQALQAELSASVFDRLDAEAFERLEEALILADVGAPGHRRGGRAARGGGRVGRTGPGDGVRERLMELLAEMAGSADARIDLTRVAGRC